MKVGKYSVDFLETGTFALDGGAMFGVVPKPLWEKTNRSDNANRITLGARCLLLQRSGKKILVDTGLGENWDEKFTNIYAVDQKNSSLVTSIGNFGLTPDDITDVIITHLHFDHTGGSTKLYNGKMIPAFPNAEYHIQRKHFEWASKPSFKDKASFVKDRFVPLMEEGVLRLHDGNEFDDGISFEVMNGHSFSMQMVKIFDSSKTLLYCADLIPTSSHIPLPYIMGYDLQPLITLEEKKKILPKAVEEEWILLFEHDPEILGATVSMSEKGFKVKEKFTEL